VGLSHKHAHTARRGRTKSSGAPPASRKAGRRETPQNKSTDAARNAAVRAIAAVVTQGKSVGAALEAAFNGSDLDARDRAFAANLTRVTLRRYRSLLAAVDTYMPRGRPTNAGPLNAILATAAAQLLLLKLPAHAVINVAVAQAGQHRRSQNFKGLVNAVLRKIATSGGDAFATIDCVATDIPAWMLDRWTAAYGPDAARALAAACLEPAHLDLTAKDDPAAVAEAVGGHLLATGTIRCDVGQRVDGLAGFETGDWWVQDAAAALPALLLGAQPGEHILDVCAAPGGKTLQLAAAGARVTAIEIDESRLARIAENLTRVGVEAELVAADAATYQPGEPVDRILLDVPCSATGTIRRHPDILHNKRTTDITANTATQAALLDRAIGLMKSGGTLVYCSCSLEPEEGPEQIASALARHTDLRREPVRAGESGIPAAWITADGDLRTRPDFAIPSATTADGLAGATDSAAALIEAHGMDGFFAARLVKS
jgi:16S rRNA (cytosine967-C5)-methyltransferase